MDPHAARVAVDLANAFSREIENLSREIENRTRGVGSFNDDLRKLLIDVEKDDLASRRNTILEAIEKELQVELSEVFDKLKLTFERIHGDELDAVFAPSRGDILLYVSSGQGTYSGYGYAKILSGILKLVQDRAWGIYYSAMQALESEFREDFEGEVCRYYGIQPSDIARMGYHTWFQQFVRPVMERMREFIESEYLAILHEAKHRSDLLTLSLGPGEVFAGNRAARKIFTSAKRSLDIIDTWLGPAVFDMLEVTGSSVQIRLITDDRRGASGSNLRGFNATVDAFKRFNEQYGRTELRLAPRMRIHDRYIIVDQLMSVHLGPSIKDLGRKKGEIKPEHAPRIFKEFIDLWNSSTPVS
jgi:hypothetical protein